MKSLHIFAVHRKPVKYITMKAAFWFIILSIALGSSAFSQEMNKKIMDPKYDEEILIGYCTKDALMQGDFGAVFSEEYAHYEVDMQYIDEIFLLNSDDEVLIVLGTWCHDSQEQVPRFFRVMETVKYPEELITIICVDGNKTGGDLDISDLDIVKVPTFIFYRDGEEIGRIIETPEDTLEQDMFEILN